ncbi:formyl transferase [Rhizobiaceae bacterium BDR2-2]|uniref:phosphoribosylglycinamide formyltransferase 1 n=1 Tax=Ectorhizobium quercum TaxID=2965071 RepID=A0AAE3SX16_9HYPH|nr:formyl transferase [Ectorhizobium quercum]MCX8999772.1 formyl transferase [Ectorhizobium quercum]
MDAGNRERLERGSAAVVVLAGPGLIPAILVNALATAFPGRVTVIEETPLSPFALARRRARRLGWIAALGQLATSIVSRLTKTFAQARSQAILSAYGHAAERNRDVPVIRVRSVNDDATHEAIARLQPAAVLTVACRLLTKKTLSRIPCPIINFHGGINPAYRGQMGGYWALAAGDRDNFGCTIHLVDSGVDTGATLYDVRLQPDPADTMATYPLLLAAAGAEKTVQAVQDALSGTLKPFEPARPSRMHYPPTLWRWLWNGLSRGVW